MMKKYLESLLKKSKKPLGTIVCIGAGSGSEISALHSLAPDKIIAVEASPKLFSSLNRKSKKLTNVAAFNKWILPTGTNTATAFLYNNPRYNSLSHSESFDLVHPNVKLEKSVTVSGEPIDLFIGEVKLDPNTTNVLIVLSPDAKGNLLKGVDSRYIQLFDILVLAEDTDELYKKPTLVESQFCSYEKVFFLEEEKGLFEYYLQSESIRKFIAQVESLQTEKQELQQKNTSLSEQVNQLTQENKALESSLADIERQRTIADQKFKELSTQYEQVKFELESEKTDCKNLRDQIESQELYTAQLEQNDDDQKKLLEQFNTESKELNSKLSGLQDRVEKLQYASEDKSSKLMECDQQLAETKKMLDCEKNNVIELKERVEELLVAEQQSKQDNALLIEKNGYLTEQLKVVNGQYATMSKIADTNAKLLLKVQNDSEALRNLIVAKNSRIEELTSLIKRLHDKLSQASHAYAQLQQKHPELDWERI